LVFVALTLVACREGQEIETLLPEIEAIEPEVDEPDFYCMTEEIADYVTGRDNMRVIWEPADIPLFFDWITPSDFDLLAEYALYLDPEIDAWDAEGAGDFWRRIVFRSELALRDFRYLSIVHDDYMQAHRRDVLYTLEVLEPEIPFVASFFPQCFTSNFGFSFVDGYGRTRYFEIWPNNEDGGAHLMFSEFSEPDESTVFRVLIHPADVHAALEQLRALGHEPMLRTDDDWGTRVQVASFREVENARRLVRELERDGFWAMIQAGRI